jgi:hypothetical protein
MSAVLSFLISAGIIAFGLWTITYSITSLLLDASGPLVAGAGRYAVRANRWAQR